MASIIVIDENTPKERYKVLYDVPTLNGKRKRKSKTFPHGTPKKDINSFKRKKELELEQNNALDYHGQKKTFRQFTLECFEHYMGNLSPTTLVSYESIFWNRGMNEFLGDLPLDKISYATMQAYVNHLQKDRKLSPKSIRNQVFFASKIFRLAIQCQLIDRHNNPTEYLILPPKEKKEVKFYTVEQVQQFLHIAEQEDEAAFLIIALGALTGMRKGELSALKWKNCYLSDGLQELHIVENRIRVTNQGVITKQPKTDAGKRIIQLGNGVARILRRAKKEQQKRAFQGLSSVPFSDECYVITQPNGEGYMPDSLYVVYRKFVMAHPEIAPYCRLHSLRNTYATLSAVATSDKDAIKYQMGHKSVLMTESYIGIYEDSKKVAAQQLDQLIFGDKDAI